MPHRSSAAEDVHALPLQAFSGKEKAILNVSLVSSAEELRRINPELNALRLRSASPDALVSLPGWFVAHQPAVGWAHRILLLCTGARLDAAVFLRERIVLGLPTGYFYGADALGETLILCETGQEQQLLSKAIELLLQQHRSFLVLLDEIVPESSFETRRFDPSLRVRSAVDSVYWQHRLETSFDATLRGFGHRTRRNLRYALRRTEKNKWQFFPELNAAQIGDAISQLSSRSTHPFPVDMGTMRLHLTAKTPGSFAMGLADAEGNWLSCLIGRRIGGVAEVFWQSNAAGYGTDSLCMTMRSLFMRDEITRETTQVRYIGGTCALMQHCCTPSPSLQISVARPGLRLMLLTAVMRFLPKADHPRRRQFIDEVSK
jgi:hypothetical protein